MELERLSPTQIGMYLRCPRSWAYRYLEGIKIPPSGAMVKGRSTHKGAEHNYRQKIQTMTDEPVSIVVEAAINDFEEALQKEEIDFRGEDKGKAKDAVADMSTAYHRVVAPTIQPIACEQEFLVEIEGENLLGVIDVVSDKHEIRDIKTAGKTPPASVLEDNLQLAAYSVGHEHLYGVLPTRVGLDYLVSLKSGVKVVPFTDKPSEQAIYLLEASVREIAKGIRAEVFPPNTSGWWCGKEQCGYYEKCRKERRKVFVLP